MTLDTLIIFCGAVIAILPFLGFPVSWDHALFFILGMCVIALGIGARRRFSRRPQSITHADEHAGMLAD